MITDNLIPAEGKPDVGHKVFELLDEILEDKEARGLPRKWVRFYELGKNKHWKNKPEQVKLITANLLNTHRQRIVNLLTDNNPTFNVVRSGDTGGIDEDTHLDLLRACEDWWGNQEQQHILEKSVKTGETYGAVVEKILFNPELEYGLGEVETEIVDLFNFGVYPVDCTDINKAEAVLHFRPMSIREAKRKWPKHADEIVTDSQKIKDLGDDRREVAMGGKASGLLSTISSVVKHLISTSGEGAGEKDETLVVECWFRDYTDGEDGSPKYPGYIRRIITCNCGEVVLEDRWNPSINPELPTEEAQKTYLFDRYPFSITSSNTDPICIWGESDYEQLEGLQIEINKALSQFVMIKDKVSRLKLIVPKDCGVPVEHFTNAPGIIEPKSGMAAQGIRYLEPPQIPTDLLAAKDIFKDMFFLVSGAFELEQAQTPGKEVIAHRAIALLVERASTMLRGKIRNYSKMVRERGRMYISLLQSWYTEERWITYKQGDDQTIKPILGRNLIIPSKLTIVTGSTMPRSQIQEREEAIALLKMGVIDPIELLKKIDWPDYNQVIERMQAGPFGEFFNKMGEIGVPPQLIEFFMKLSKLDRKEIGKAAESGKLPPFQMVMQALLSGGQEQQAPPDPMQGLQLQIAQADAMLKQAQAQKAQAEAKRAEIQAKREDYEAQLVLEKINSERLSQQVKTEGVKLDWAKITLEKAATASAIRASSETGKINKARAAADIRDKALSSTPSAQFTPMTSTPVARERNQGPYNERGLVSNNEEV